ncbi:kinase-like domain-containing protein [Dichotomocladium elegans]|nr:kinase-like domain-containing protein [Dichotomocladium elegans]
MTTDKVQELQLRLDNNQKRLEKAQELRSKLKDRAAVAQCEIDINDYRRRIEYFHRELARLDENSVAMLTADNKNNSDGYSRSKKYNTDLDLLTTATPYHKSKVSLKLHQLQYKLEIAEKMLDGFTRLASALNSSYRSRRQSAEVQAHMQYCREKLRLLRRALQKYEELYIDDGENDDESDGFPWTEKVLPLFIRRPVSGRLQLKLVQARDLGHTPTRVMKSPMTVIEIKVDGEVVHTTHPSRNDRWFENCDVHVSEGSELEIEIYDEDSNSKRREPIGVLWMQIADIAEALRKRRIQNNSWRPLPSPSPSPSPSESSSSPDPQQPDNKQHHEQPLLQPPFSTPSLSEPIFDKFEVEPCGELALRVNFIREPTKYRARDKLGRAGALRYRRGKRIYEINGHRFVEQQFYNIMKCAVCNEFLVNSGFQCEGCRYLCHKECHTRTISRCVSLSHVTTDSHNDEDLNHRIPHRFVSVTNIKAKWCGHCGHVLPLGSRGTQRCAECSITCHTRCAHLMPDLCGLSPERANQILAEIRAAKGRHPATRTGSSGDLVALTRNGSFEDDSVDSLSVQVSEDIRSTAVADEKTIVEIEPDHVDDSSVFTMQPETPHPRVQQTDFMLLRVIGKGSFGKVLLARNHKDNHVYALKVLKKRFIIDGDGDAAGVEGAFSEKKIFTMISKSQHPFLTNMHSCFQSDSHIFFAMEYICGGDLMSHIQRERFSLRRAKFYASEVVLALEHLHKLGIVYRDLKLENILLCADGHIKLADFGMCKYDMWYGSRTSTLCGTPESMAPEIILQQGYGRAVDWWALGVLIFQMIFSQSPFYGEGDEDIWQSILHDEIEFPPHASSSTVSICRRLLDRDPALRLGSGETDAAEIKQHHFFEGVNWDQMLARATPPPFFPTVRGILDTSNFDDEFTQEDVIISPVTETLTPEEQREFQGFSFTAEPFW